MHKNNTSLSVLSLLSAIQLEVALYLHSHSQRNNKKMRKDKSKQKLLEGNPAVLGWFRHLVAEAKGMSQYPFAISFLLGLILSSSSLFCYSELSKSYFKLSLVHYVLTYFFLSLLILPSFLNFVTWQHLLLLPFLLSTLLLFLS